MLVRMADSSMFCVEPSVTLNNTHGAILFQILLQIYQGTDVLNVCFENILNRVLERLNTQPLKTSLHKHLLCVFLSALIYNSSATLKFLEMKGVSKNILGDIIKFKKNFGSKYEQKCFIVGLTKIISTPDAPEVVKNPATISRLIQEILGMLDAVQKKEQKEASKQARKQIQQDEDEDSDATSSEGSEDEYGDEDEVTELDNGKRSRSNSGHRVDDKDNGEEMMNDEEQKDPTEAASAAKNEFGLGFANGRHGKRRDNDDSESSGSEYDNTVSTS